MLNLLVWLFLAFVFTVLPFWKIFQRVGHGGGMSLLMLIPVVNVIALFWLAFGDWPIERELELYRR